MSERTSPTHLIRLNRANLAAQLDWSIGYEGLKFNCYKNEGGTDWIYEDEGGLYFISPEQATECGKAHDTTLVDGNLVCRTCVESTEIYGFVPRRGQELIRDFLMLHGAPRNWALEAYVLRDERRYHYADYAKLAEPDASKTGLIVTATRTAEGKIVVTDNEGGTYVRQ